MKYEYGKGFTMVVEPKRWNDIREKLKQEPCSQKKPTIRGRHKRAMYLQMEELIHTSFGDLGEIPISKDLYIKMYNFWWGM